MARNSTISGSIENFRAFKGHHEYEIRPITIIVGENSTGKSSLLSAMAGTINRAFPYLGSLAKDPFKYGSFSSMATDGESRFVLTRKRMLGNFEENIRVQYISVDDLPFPELIEYELSGLLQYSARISSRKKYFSVSGSFRDQGKQVNIANRNINLSDVYPGDIRQILVSGYLGQILASKMFEQTSIWKRVPFEVRYRLANSPNQFKVIAPIRSKPQKSYEIFESDTSVYGDHVPNALRSVFKSRSTRNKNIVSAIKRFGAASGLFSDIGVKDITSGLFQIILTTQHGKKTPIDVGYGVSQVLPIVFECLDSSENSTVFIEQPEVHLHPRAQAELGSFFCSAARNRGQNFVIETHSDYLVDRLRVEISSGRFSNSDAVILFLETVSAGVVVHFINIDSAGNLINAPESFREFFYAEQGKLLGFT